MYATELGINVTVKCLNSAHNFCKSISTDILNQFFGSLELFCTCQPTIMCVGIPCQRV